ncbi:hypothetical protein M758_1G159900 [Ceratodon purpureus]|nr:hypothetical protein M758_1G159900 [Ceratodon purpureus]
MGGENETAVETTSTRPPSKANMITPGCAVLLDINNGDKLTFAHLNKNASVKIGNIKCWLDALVGHPFGSVFEVQSGAKGASFVRVSPSGADLREGIAEKDDGEAAGDEVKSKDNRALIDNNTAQTLSAEDINKMRTDGVSGKEIMEALVANSATFHTKTAFSQEKYLRKKQKKYAPRVVVRRPSARSVCEAYFAKDPNKTGHLRMDMLALILSLANVGANAEVLVLDMLGGLLTASVAERLGGYGCVCSTYNTHKPPTIDMVRLFNFDASTSSGVVRAPASQLISARIENSKLSAEAELKRKDGDDDINIILNETTDVSTSGNSMEVDGTTSTTETVEVSVATETTVILESVEGERTTKTTQILETVALDSRLEETPKIETESTGKRKAGTRPDEFEAGKSIKPGRLASDEDRKRWAIQGFTSLIVGAPFLDPWTVVEKLLPLLAPSAPFVIYHPYLQPLAECMNKLQSEHMAVGLQLQEPWLREYQVLPSRTHPNMQMSSTGGWVLSGIRINKA